MPTWPKLAALVCGLALVVAAPAPAAVTPAWDAAAFRDSVGVQTHITYYDTPYARWPALVEKLDELAASNALAAQVSTLATASALIGREITVLDEDGDPQTTTVLRGEFAAGQLTLQTGRGPITLDQVLALAAPAAPATAPTTPDPTPTTHAEGSPTTESSPS